jgi:hypothetical protein
MDVRKLSIALLGLGILIPIPIKIFRMSVTAYMGRET